MTKNQKEKIFQFRFGPKRNNFEVINSFNTHNLKLPKLRILHKTMFSSYVRFCELQFYIEEHRQLCRKSWDSVELIYLSCFQTDRKSVLTQPAIPIPVKKDVGKKHSTGHVWNPKFTNRESETSKSKSHQKIENPKKAKYAWFHRHQNQMKKWEKWLNLDKNRQRNRITERIL